MTSAESDRIDALHEQGRQTDAHGRCDLWRAAARDIPKIETGAKSYAEAAAKDACDHDPAQPFLGSLADRAATIARSTEGFYPRGANLVLHVNVEATTQVKRGECLKVVVLFPEGFTPTQMVWMKLRYVDGARGDTEVSGGFSGPGPVFIGGIGCVSADTDVAITLTGQPGLSAPATLFMKTISDAELAEVEARRREGERHDEADARRFRAERNARHCERCASDRDTCGQGPACLAEWSRCLEDDLNDEPLRPEQCLGGSK